MEKRNVPTLQYSTTPVLQKESRRFAMQGTMKAARIYGFEKTSKSSDLLRVDEVPIPDIESGEVLIRVLRAGLNHGDLHMREDAVQYTSEVPTIPFLPMVIGHDGLGEVVEVGPDVANVRIGDLVVVMCSITCGYCKFCRSDRQHLCLSHRVMGFIAKWGEAGSKRILRYKEGLWAEYCRVPATNVVRLRPDDDINEMCKVSQMTVGYRALKRARLHSGETVIVNGATGITGIGTVLSALAMGAARVIAIARNPVRLEKLSAIDPKRIATVALGKGESITQKVKALTDGQGASVVADRRQSRAAQSSGAVSDDPFYRDLQHHRPPLHRFPGAARTGSTRGHQYAS